MTLDRIKDIFCDFKDALERLKEALADDPMKNNIVIDGTIQRFEFSFELAWKLMKAILNYNGIDADMPRPVLKEAYKAGIITKEQTWIDMLEDRNKTSHIYDEKEALKIYGKIKGVYFQLLKDLENEVSKTYSK